MYNIVVIVALSIMRESVRQAIKITLIKGTEKIIRLLGRQGRRR